MVCRLLRCKSALGSDTFMISIVVNLSSLWICRKNYCTAAIATAVIVMVVLDF